MPTLRVLVHAPWDPERPERYVLVDRVGRPRDEGPESAARSPAHNRTELLLAGSHVRIVPVPLPPMSVAAREAVSNATPRLAARPDALPIECRDTDARLVIDAPTVAAPAAWLETLQRETSTRILETTLTGRAERALLRAELTFGR